MIHKPTRTASTHSRPIRLVVPTMLAALLAGGLASAQTATFRLDRTEAPEKIYERFEKVAAAACHDAVRSEGPMALNTSIERRERCTADLLGQAIEQARIPALAAIHAGEGPALSGATLAQVTGTASE
ncbi:MAG: hypothetical protein AAGJ32_01980 [Pseudomonadota bacterium]